MSFAKDISVFIIAKVYHMMLINIMVLNEFSILSVNLAPEPSVFLMFYKVLGSGFPNVAKHCFTNGFFDIPDGPWGKHRSQFGWDFIAEVDFAGA